MTSAEWILRAQPFCFTALAKVKCASRFTTTKSKFAKRPFPDCGYWKLGRLKASLRPCCLVQSKRPFQTEPIALKSLKTAGRSFAAPAILGEINEALAQTDVSKTDPDTVPRQIDMVRQPLTPTDRTFILTCIGEGSLSIELSGFAESRIFSTKVRGLWRSVIINNNHKVLLDSLCVTHVPPEVPASLDDMGRSAKLVRETIEWIERDLERGALG